MRFVEMGSCYATPLSLSPHRRKQGATVAILLSTDSADGKDGKFYGGGCNRHIVIAGMAERKFSAFKGSVFRIVIPSFTDLFQVFEGFRLRQIRSYL